MTCSLEFDVDERDYEKMIKDRIRKMHDDESSILYREIKYDPRKNGYYIGHRDKHSVDIETKIDSMVQTRSMSESDVAKLYRKTFADNALSFRIIIDGKNKKTYIQSNHAYYDGWTIANIMSELLSFDDAEKYCIKLPKFRYIPFFTEYCLLKTYIQARRMKGPQIIDKGSTDYHTVKEIVHVKLTRNEIDKSKPYMVSYIHKIMQYFFEAYPGRDHYNVMLLFAIDNPNKINNIATIVLTIKRKYSVDEIEKKIRSRRHMVIGSYFYINSSLNRGGESGNIDISFSSLPVFKTHGLIDHQETVLPYCSTPIYISNSKIGDISTTSVHFREQSLNPQTFKNVLMKHNVKVHKVTELLEPISMTQNIDYVLSGSTRILDTEEIFDSDCKMVECT